MATTTSTSWTHKVTETEPVLKYRLTAQPILLSERYSSGASPSAAYHDDMLRRQIEQARQQRTGFYRRLVDVGRRSGITSASEPSIPESMSGRRANLSSLASDGVGRRRFLRESADGTIMASETTETPSVSVDVGLMHHDQLVFTEDALSEAPKPQTSWRYYTSYDKDLGEWRRNAVPVFKAEESDAGHQLRAKSEHDDDDPETRQLHQSAMDRYSRPRGCASLLQPAISSSVKTFDSRRAGSEDVTSSQNYSMDNDDRTDLLSGGSSLSFSGGDHLPNSGSSLSFRGGDHFSSSYVENLKRQVLGDSWHHSSSDQMASAEERVIYANPSRTSIFDNVANPTSVSTVEIPEGTDEAQFVEKTLTPSGKPWESAPSLSERILMMSTATDDGDDADDWFEGGSTGFNVASRGSSVGFKELKPMCSETTTFEETRRIYNTGNSGRSAQDQLQTTLLDRSDENSVLFKGNRSTGSNRMTFDDDDKFSPSAPALNNQREASSRVYENATQRSSKYSINEVERGRVTRPPHDVLDRDDVVWMPVIRVQGPASTTAKSSDTDDREPISHQKTGLMSSSTSRSTEPPTVSSLSGGPAVGRETVESTFQCSQTVVRPVPISMNSPTRVSLLEHSPTSNVVVRDTQTITATNSLFKPIEIRRLTLTSDGAARDVDMSSKTTAEGSSSMTSRIGGGRENNAFEISESTGSGLTTARSTAVRGHRRGLSGSGSGMGVFRSETCFSVDAIAPDQQPEEATSTLASNMSSTTRTAAEQISPVSGTSTIWKSTTYASTSNAPESGNRRLHYESTTKNAAADEGDWVIEKAI